MDLTQLKHFSVVAEYEHMTKAAEFLHISQPALSKSISNLENELGIRLFDRSRGRIMLNEYGRIFYRQVTLSLKNLHDGIDMIRDRQQTEDNRISFATSMAGFISMPLKQYLISNPQIHVSQSILGPEDMKQALKERDIDFAISFIPIHDEDIVWTPLVEDEMLLYISTDNPLARKKTFSLRDLVNERIIFNNNNIGVRDSICSYCNSLGFSLNIFYEGNEDEAVISLVEKNLGMVFVPATTYYWKTKEFPTHTKLPVRVMRMRDPVGRRVIGVARYKNRRMGLQAKGFYDFILSHFEALRQDLINMAIEQPPQLH